MFAGAQASNIFIPHLYTRPIFASQLHEEYFGKRHNDHVFIGIERYMRRPDYYTQPKCPDHGFLYSSCCERCYTLKCLQCPKEDEKNCKGKHKILGIFIDVEVSKF